MLFCCCCCCFYCYQYTRKEQSYPDTDVVLTLVLLHLLFPSKGLASRSDCLTSEMVPADLRAAFASSVEMQEMWIHTRIHITFFPWFLNNLVFIKYIYTQCFVFEV